MTIRKRPKPAPRRQLEGWRSRITTAADLVLALDDAKARGFINVFLVRRRDLLDTEIMQRISAAPKSLLVELDDTTMLATALSWLHQSGGVVIWATHYGQVEQLG